MNANIKQLSIYALVEINMICLLAIFINLWADYATTLKTNPALFGYKVLCIGSIMVATTIHWLLTRRYLWASLTFAPVATVLSAILATELGCLNYPKMEFLKGTEAMITMIATLSIIAYD
jgi:hypothetical protein